MVQSSSAPSSPPRAATYATPSPRTRIAKLTLEQWKILIVDEYSEKIINNVVKEDDILNANITSTLHPAHTTCLF